MVKVMNTFQMALFIEDNLNKELNMGEVFLNGRMDKYMMVNGKMDTKQEVACGRILKDRVIWESGKMIRFKVLVFLL